MARILASCRLPLAEVLPTLRAHGLLRKSGGLDRPVLGQGVVRTDSRKIEGGDIFLAYRGVSSDGHDHLAKAESLGASLLVVEDAAKLPQNSSVPWVEVKNGRAAWARLAAQAFGNPQDRLAILGVTGTNGKTSTTWMIGQLLQASATPCLVIGTIGAYLAGEHLPTTHTTPDPDVLFGLFAAAVDQGVQVVVMEVSSHAVMQEKVGPIRFAACAFTSFSRDHLDFHGTMEEYWAAKWRFFKELMMPTATVAFADVLGPTPDLPGLSRESVVYGFDPEPKRVLWGAKRAVSIREERSDVRGSRISVTDGARTLKGDVPYFAKHALENFTAALVLAGTQLGGPPDPKTWAKLKPIPGRLEQVTGPGGPSVVVDYAHTPDALEKTLQVLRPLTKGRLIVVFGCGGDRDKGKRPEMGKIASNLADEIYLTSDNPRSEAPDGIIRDIAGGIVNFSRLTVEVDRAKAIDRAITKASPTDVVLIAGKGHETYQIFSDRTVDFDDREVARASLAKA